MALENALLIADVAHARQRPRRNAFCYKVYYLCFSLSDMAQLGRLLLCSLNRINLFSFHARDHGSRDGQSIEAWIRGVLKEWDIPHANGKIVLLTMPRVLGHVFNPVSFWFCLDDQEDLRAVLSEVNNTFGDRHCYISFHPDRRPITANDMLRSEKIFHVSPFIEIRGHYQFRFAYREDKVGVWIDHYDDDGLLLTTSLTGKRQRLTSAALLYCFFRYPLVTLKVIGLIHFQAMKLWLKRVRYVPHTAPPSKEVSS